MTLVTALWVALGAAVGAPTRYLADRALQAAHGTAFPWGTFTVNVTAALVLGIVLGGTASDSLCRRRWPVIRARVTVMGVGALVMTTGVIAALLEPETVDLGKGPTIERGAALIAMLFGEHAPERPAEQASAGAPFAGEEVGEAHEPRQH